MEDVTVQQHGSTSFITDQSLSDLCERRAHTHRVELMLGMGFYLKQQAESFGNTHQWSILYRLHQI